MFHQEALPRIIFLYLLYVGARSAGQAAALGFQAMEENCILSFVVPRDKMKSSCELDEKVNRRINAMEMKVNIYKQQVSEMQVQLDKQRQVNAEKLERLEREVMDSRVNTDMSFLIERRLALLEKEFEQMYSEVTSSRHSEVKMKPTTIDDTGYVFNAIGNSPTTLPNMVKSLVQSEMKGLIENFTTRFETYVQEQILLYNQVFNMLPKRNDISTQYGRASSPITKDKSKIFPKDGKPDPESPLMKEFESVKLKLEDTGDKTAKEVGSYIKNVTGEKTTNPSGNTVNATVAAASGTTAASEELPIVNSSEIVLGEDVFESNESFSGENPELNDTAHEHSFTAIDNDISGTAATRKTNKSDDEWNSTNPTSLDDDEKNWKENMVRDQFYTQAEMEGRLKDMITSMLYSPLAEVMSLVEKQTKALEEQIKAQEEKNQQANKDLTTHVKNLDQNVQAINLQLESLSQGFQDSFVKLEKLKPLEILVNEIKKNISSNSLSASALEMDEQTKKLKKLERLMGVYHESLEHFRNETKHEYREIKDSLEKETTKMRTMSTSLSRNVTTTVRTAINGLNATYMSKFNDIDEQIRIHEDNVLLFQIDLNTFERKLNSKSTRSDRDLENLQDAMDQLAVKQRDFRKKLEQVDQSQTTLSESINMTAKDVFDLKTEVKLSILDEWIAITFDYDSSRTDCYGDQFVRRTQYKPARLVGVVLCSPKRYKIFLSNSLLSTFRNIGDGNGMGEDHCEFVGGTPESKIKLSPFRSVYGAVQGYSRSTWGQKPAMSFLNAIKPSPHWYECGVTIP